MATQYDWPAENRRNLIGKRINRLDGMEKSSGRAKYSYDRNPRGLIHAKLVLATVASGTIKSIDLSAAEKMPGFRAYVPIKKAGDEVQWQNAELGAIAADTEEQARDCALAVKVDYERTPHLVHEENLDNAGGRTTVGGERKEGDPEAGFGKADVVHEGYYGLPTITHCCLEPHGQVVDWQEDGTIVVYASTQAVARIGPDLATNLSKDPEMGEVSAGDVHIITPHMGGGFGSKFAIDSWGIACAKLSKKTGRPVKLMLERREEVSIAGGRPSDYGKVKVGAKSDGTLTAWESESWSTGGFTTRGAPPIPYVVEPPDRRNLHIAVSTNTGPSRAWRAPNHPQACVITQCALDDLAAKLKMDPLDFFEKNLQFTPRPDVYRSEIAKAAEIIDWKSRWHQRGDKTSGPVKKGVGMAIHTWGGRPHDSTCKVRIYPNGLAEAELASQDLGVGLRTVVGIVLAETMGLPLEKVRVKIGDSSYPVSGASGGSTSTGGVSSSTRRAAIDALGELAAVVAESLGTEADDIEAWDGHLWSKSDNSKKISWADACKKLGPKTIETLGKQPDRNGGKLADSGVGGVSMAAVEVDTETGVVSIDKMVLVQDIGLVINLKTAESQVYGAMIQGVAWALYEERIYDQPTGHHLNADMEFYKLSGIGDIGEFEVHIVQGDYDDRGVIGLGEPPAISPGAAISNAVANAIGVRVPTLPLTPDKVLAALSKGGMA